MTWIVKVGDQYLALRDGDYAECHKAQKKALRFSSASAAYKAAHRTFGLADPDDDDDDLLARVVRLVSRPPIPGGTDG